MSSSRAIWLSLLVWTALWSFWFLTTRWYHPTTFLAVVVTTTLIRAYATAVCLNKLVLIPRYWRGKHLGLYSLWLLGTMAILTAIARAIIRTTYFLALGPDPDPYGLYRHYAIDFLGMVVHVVVAAGLFRLLAPLWQRALDAR
jgi:hypothetical protein